jgi:hypothetical protein
METISHDGHTLPLAADTVLSLATVSVWGCPACRSAHGSGIYPSRAVSAMNLATNKFYYRPSDQRLFTISNSCRKKYVKDLGADTPARFAAVIPQAVVTSMASARPVPARSETTHCQAKRMPTRIMR